MRVHVPFGRGDKLKLGYIAGFTAQPGIAPDKIKTVAGLCGDYPVFTSDMLALALWMKEMYYAPLALCLQCLLPAGMTESGIPPDIRSKKKTANAKSHLSIHTEPPQVLTDEQRFALQILLPKLRETSPAPVLLHGVTGSGKTEVYLRLIAEVLRMGKQAVVLVPEIALTPQAVSSFTERFGEAVAVTHSRLSNGERFRLWKKALDGEVSVMIGPRSAVFAPFDRLGVLIVDEEHEHTYQSEITPKYDAREVALKRAEITGALVVMGSATPSLESYYRAVNQNVYLNTAENADTYIANRKFELIQLTQRVNRMFPRVKVVDMRREMAQGNTSLFGRPFMEAMAETFSAGKQAILFLNRRGHSSFVSCRMCGHVLKCDRCDVNYTWHAIGERLICHYCGRETRLPPKCPACGSEYMQRYGVGTQKVEEEMNRLFPGVPVLRMDMDTTRGKNGHAKILDAFRRGEAQALVGTQMIAKGLDFPNVILVGVVAADMSLFSGDFRAGEHTFQLLTQVSGRAGRANESGRVFFQTYNPEHYCLELAQRGDYEAFYRQEIAVRFARRYPPFTHIFQVLFVGADEKAVILALRKLLAVMEYCNRKNLFEILGPTPAFVSKIKKQFRWKLLVKADDREFLKQFVLYCIRKLKENDPLPGIAAYITLDPAVTD
jgi:primosomal protein N' (replication factor Y)